MRYQALLLRAVTDLLRLAAASTALIHNTGVRSIGADVLKRSRVPIVGVDARDLSSVSGGDALDVDVPLALGLAVPAGAVDLAVVFGVEVDDVDGAAAVLGLSVVVKDTTGWTYVLDDLVGRVVGASADDPGLLSSLVVFVESR